jgi:hypothetical protein
MSEADLVLIARRNPSKIIPEKPRNDFMKSRIREEIKHRRMLILLFTRDLMTSQKVPFALRYLTANGWDAP